MAIKELLNGASLLAMAVHAPNRGPSQQQVEDTGMDMVKDLGLLDDLGETNEGDDADTGDQNDFSADDEGDPGDDQDPDPREGDDLDFEQPPARQQQRQQRPKDFRKRRDPQRPEINFAQQLQRDQAGNIVNGNGQVIAKAGAEARFYEQVHGQARAAISNFTKNAGQQLKNAEQKYKRAAEIGLEIHNRMQQMEQTYAPMKALGLSPQEQVRAATLFSRAKTEPLAVLKELLTQASISGIDLGQLGLQTGAFDPKSLTALIESKIKESVAPVSEFAQTQRQRSEEEQATAAAMQRAEEITTEFFQANETAAPFAHVFKAALEKEPNLTLPEIWTRMQLHAMRQGIDITDPRVVRRLMNRQGQQQRRPNNWVPPRGGRMPQGGGQNRSEGPAPVSESYESIVKALLK